MKRSLINNWLNKITVLSVICSFGFFYASSSETYSEKSSATIQLSFHKMRDQNRIATATVTTKAKEGRPIFVRGVKVNFYVNDKSGQLPLGSTYTDLGGQARITLPEDLPVDAEGMATLTVKIENDPLYSDVEVEGSVKEANLVLSVLEMDTVKMITAKLTKISPDRKEIPVNEVEVIFYVQRLFGPMSLTEEATVKTDKNGIATFDFPKGIKGDEQGNIKLVARIEDNEMFGNIESVVKTQWGIPLVIEKHPFPTDLWEPNAPLWLKLSFTIVFGGIWIIYLFILYQLVRLQKKPSTE